MLRVRCITGRNLKLQYERHVNYNHSYVKSKDTEKWIYDDVLKFVRKNFKGFELVLDCGCGYGRSTGFIKTKAKKIVALDISKKALSKAIKYTKRKAHLINADAEDLPFKDKTFDLVLSIEVLSYTDNPEKALKEISRVLKDNGVAIISIENKYGGILSDHSLTPSELIKAMEKGRTEKTIYFTEDEFCKILQECGFSVMFKDRIGFTSSGIFHRFHLNRRNMEKIEKLCKKDPVLSSLSRGICFVCKKIN